MDISLRACEHDALPGDVVLHRAQCFLLQLDLSVSSLAWAQGRPQETGHSVIQVSRRGPKYAYIIDLGPEVDEREAL